MLYPDISINKVNLIVQLKVLWDNILDNVQYVAKIR